MKTTSLFSCKRRMSKCFKVPYVIHWLFIHFDKFNGYYYAYTTGRTNILSNLITTKQSFTVELVPINIFVVFFIRHDIFEGLV